MGRGPCEQTDKKFVQALETGIRLGKWVLVENVPERLDNVLEALLLQQRFKQGGAEMIKIGDLIVPYNDAFRCRPMPEPPPPTHTHSLRRSHGPLLKGVGPAQ